jgi:hypothetical protein
MRFRAQTAKIANGFVLFPKEAPWLDTYLRELLSFPNSKYDDQVDSTVFALAWVTEHPEPGIIGYYRQLAEQTANRHQIMPKWFEFDFRAPHLPFIRSPDASPFRQKELLS